MQVTDQTETGKELHDSGPTTSGLGDLVGDGARPPIGPPESAYRLGMALALASISVSFLAFTSAYIVRQGISGDWGPITLPNTLWVSTALLLLSSGTFEAARNGFKKGSRAICRRWLWTTLLLGLGFLGGQILTWWELDTAGIYIDTSPHSAFFYILTGAHGLHLSGGLLALIYLVIRASRNTKRISQESFPGAIAMDLAGLYWHFMDGLWVCLFILLSVGR